MRIRFADPADSAALLRIYAQYIETPITFEYALPTEREFAERIARMGGFYPYLACEENGRMIGYAYAHRHMEREAYQWNAELSVYLDRDATSKGLGRKLYLMLISILKLQGIKTVYGCVTLPNARSEALHQGLGFTMLGTYRNAGFKGGKWHDVGWFEKPVAEYDEPPQPIVSIDCIPKDVLQKVIAC